MQLRNVLTHPKARDADLGALKTQLDAQVPGHLETATFAAG
jgi:hypothetical protein